MTGAATITGTSGPHTPLVFTRYSTTRKSRNITHDIVGTADLAATLRPAGLRSGKFEGVFDDLGDALALEADLAAGDELTLVDTDHPDFGMTFILAESGSVDVEIQPTLRHWAVIWDFQEVTP